jgi:hypothetical protein
MSRDLVYLKYWKRKDLIATSLPRFTVVNYWQSDQLSEVEQIIFEQIEHKPSVLDIGAGNLRLRSKLQKFGYSGEYHTQDIGNEYKYDYTNINQIDRKYSVILCLDVIEHLPLQEGLLLIHKLIELLETEGILILQTPNARCVRNPLISDMTHLHCYNLNDLWAYLTALGLKVDGYRIVFAINPQSWLQKLASIIPKYLITRVLGLDYADNIMAIAHKIN